MNARNVLPPAARPTTKSCRFAIATMLTELKANLKLGPKALAERVGCSDGTISNAEDEENTLGIVTLLAIAQEFGPHTLSSLLGLIGMRAILSGERCAPAVAHAPVTLSEALHELIKAQSPASEGGSEVTDGELRPLLPFLYDARTAVDALIERAGG